MFHFESQLSFVRSLGWGEVFAGWKEREAHNFSWVECATRIKGWPNWESWRVHTALQLHLQDRAWALYEVKDPQVFLPNLLMGPFNGWQKYTEEKNTVSFAELLALPEPQDFFLHHSAVVSLMKQFPAPTELIGLVREDHKKIVCVEGHHRAAAVTLGQILKTPVRLSGSVFIALATLAGDETFLLDKTLEQGSSKRE